MTARDLNMKSINDITATRLPCLPERQAESNKSDYGRALLVGGSRGMSGAIALAGLATLRSGAGLVTLAVPTSIQNTVAALEPSYMTRALAEEAGQIAPLAADTILELAKSATAVALGPGLGRSPALTALVAKLYQEISQPIIVDADALFALAEHREVVMRPNGPRVLTPHPGEFARLIGKPIEAARRIAMADADDRIGLATSIASEQVVVVLKGHRTVVTDGATGSVNHTGNPGMATGGTGDVLTGVITGLICQGLSPFDGARLGVHVHGMAGDLAVQQLGSTSLIASDLIEYLPKAFCSLQNNA